MELPLYACIGAVAGNRKEKHIAALFWHEAHP